MRPLQLDQWCIAESNNDAVVSISQAEQMRLKFLSE